MWTIERLVDEFDFTVSEAEQILSAILDTDN